MKTYIGLIIIAVAASFLASCGEDWLTISNPNKQTIGTYYSTEDEIMKAVVACYDPLLSNGFPGSGINPAYLLHGFDDRVIVEQVYAENFTHNSSTGFFATTYEFLYRGNYRCNILLSKIDNPEIDMDSTLRARCKAEARFLRAVYNFYLTVLFNEPPLVPVPIDEIGQKFTNGKKADFWKFITSDLKSAAEVLPPTYGDADLGRATSGSANAMLGKAYLYRQMYDSAMHYLDEVITSGVYELSTPVAEDSANYVNAFLCNFSSIDLSTVGGHTYRAENNKESVFEVQATFSTVQWNKWLPGWGCSGSQRSAYFAPHGYRNIVPTLYAGTSLFKPAQSGTPAFDAGLKYDPRRAASLFVEGDTIEYRQDVSFPTESDATNFGYGVKFTPGIHSNKEIYDFPESKYGVRKYYFPLHWSKELREYNDPTNYRLIRYSDVLLMYAEAAILEGKNTDKGLDYYLDVRRRAGMVDEANAPESYTFADIVAERDIEFAFENMRYFDLVRWHNAELIDIKTYLPNFVVGKHEYWPIPLGEIDKNTPVLRQNPGW